MSKAGKKMIYREDDWKAEVEVLEDTSDDEWERYKLKVVKTLRESRMYKSTPDGEIFSVEQKKGIGFSGMWHLTKDN